jgi:hypothetical protein
MNVADDDVRLGISAHITATHTCSCFTLFVTGRNTPFLSGCATCREHASAATDSSCGVDRQVSSLSTGEKVMRSTNKHARYPRQRRRCEGGGCWGCAQHAMASGKNLHHHHQLLLLLLLLLLLPILLLPRPNASSSPPSHVPATSSGSECRRRLTCCGGT